MSALPFAGQNARNEPGLLLWPAAAMLSNNLHRTESRSPALKSVVVLSRQRSGSNALSGVFSRNGFTTFFEPFLLRWDTDYGFARFLDVKNTTAKALVFTPEVVFGEYLNWLSTLSQDSRAIIDIKQNQMHLFDGPSHVSGGRPGLLRLIQTRNMPIIHLIRSNLFAQYLSRQMQIATNRHHIRSPTQQPECEPFSIDIQHCEKSMKRAERDIIQLNGWNKGYRNVIELIYEASFEDNCLTEVARDAIASKFGFTLQDTESTYVKFSYDFAHLIKNKHDVVEHFKRTRYKSYVEEILV